MLLLVSTSFIGILQVDVCVLTFSIVYGTICRTVFLSGLYPGWNIRSCCHPILAVVRKIPLGHANDASDVLDGNSSRGCVHCLRVLRCASFAVPASDVLYQGLQFSLLRHRWRDGRFAGHARPRVSRCADDHISRVRVCGCGYRLVCLTTIQQESRAYCAAVTFTWSCQHRIGGRIWFQRCNGGQNGDCASPPRRCLRCRRIARQ